MKKETSINKIETLSVDIPPFTSMIWQLFWSSIGLIFTIIGVLMASTIILIFPGLSGLLVGVFLMVLCAPKASVDCPTCDTENRVTITSKQLKCEGCDTSTPLRWNNKKDRKSAVEGKRGEAE